MVRFVSRLNWNISHRLIISAISFLQREERCDSYAFCPWLELLCWPFVTLKVCSEILSVRHSIETTQIIIDKMNIEWDEILLPTRDITVSFRIKGFHTAQFSVWNIWMKNWRACNFEDDVFQGETFDLIHQENVRRLKAESKFIQHLTPSWEHGISIAFDLKLGMGIQIPPCIWFHTGF